MVWLEKLPGPMFWRNMADLRLLYLHDNGISKLENVHSLSFCPNLTALTLFNTPLCLKIAYRHIVVNSIFSLKALDYYVISDEEIIEDWRLPEKYKPFYPSFFVDFSPRSGKEIAFQEEMKMIREIISKINFVLSHHSPVLIIQKWIRGYLIRKRLCLMPLKEVLKYKRYIRDGTKGMHIRQTPAVHSSKSTLFHTIELQRLAAIKKPTSEIQNVDLKNRKELHLYLKSLKYPVLSTILRLEEKEKIKQKKSRSPPRKGLLDGRQTDMKDEMATEFRLSVCRMPFYSLGKEMQHYQDKEKEFFDAVHDMRYFTHPVPETMPFHEAGSIEKRIFARAFGTIRLYPLCAIDKAYWQSHNLDIQVEKERKVLQMLIAKNDGVEYVSRLQQEKNEKALKKYEEDKMMTDNILKEQKQEQEMIMDKMKKKYIRFLENKDGKSLENAFVQRFSNQHTALTKGLIRLDGWRKRQEIVHERKHIVKGIAEEERQRKEMLKHFNVERKQMLQRLNTDEKCFRKCLAHAMTSERFKRSKGKVEAMKKSRMKIPYSLPVIGSSGSAVPILQYEGLDGDV
ncbi:leucine-rich repeat and IQ domain-containing protein 3 isoform X2 [Sceloporus undulatus]|uniref:leucine-rich repeat and IQ domain-containing protein 3 isoform X2 n=1 Tax=Sceloporus undulatus TaxID=8520 RepID=UPI001C4AB060|nr:leucine-rich repeat and IQ domain-containing protein 3 isoform X2 [Sceloporus undulatus]XP_042322132.1 leucine-rich repeat and IQ domain-containing protein 3 isoform X2 [Sceloporus undulatus]